MKRVKGKHLVKVFLVIAFLIALGLFTLLFYSLPGLRTRSPGHPVMPVETTPPANEAVPSP